MRQIVTFDSCKRLRIRPIWGRGFGPKLSGDATSLGDLPGDGNFDKGFGAVVDDGEDLKELTGVVGDQFGFDYGTVTGLQGFSREFWLNASAGGLHVGNQKGRVSFVPVVEYNGGVAFRYRKLAEFNTLFFEHQLGRILGSSQPCVQQDHPAQDYFHKSHA